jgi:hypothetical protein
MRRHIPDDINIHLYFMKLNLLYIINISYQFVMEYNVVFRMYARYITFPYCEEKRALPSPLHPIFPIQFAFPKHIELVGLNFL